ncbi:MAG TPA: ferritin [Petrotoga sp.]|nr:MAG: Ferroxidase [Petrotoga mobilis]HBT50807.1 ferritin [Petrotoga sp.]
MKLEDKMLNALNEQINKEIFSAYLYYSMAAYFDSINLEGFANWMKAQAKEELTHAHKLYDYIYDKDGVVELGSIEKPKKGWGSPLEAFNDAYEHELSVTQSIDKLVDLAIELNDHATQSFLQWFVNEQIEEEANTKKIVDTLKMIGENKTALFMFNSQLGSRQ